ncbi:AAA family ATPase [Streptomyces sp. 21So2-11]|uniref:AAA family ATPase n=1 Tax=Streptomyces sp. 21So2-11 TaxID=3144408 RepID=UPI003219861F
MASLLTQHLDAVGVFSSRADWPLERVQQAVDNWAVRVWPEVDLFPWRQPYTPHGRTPAARFTKLTAQAGWIAVPLPPEEFIALLPATKRVVGRHGLRLMNRWYDSTMLNALRRSATPSGNQGPFEVRWEPYDSRQVWVRSPELGWIPVPLATTATRASSTRSVGGKEVGTATPFLDSDGATNKVMARTTGSVLQAGELKRAALRLSAAAPNLSGRQRVRVPSIDDPDPVRVAYHAQLPIYTTGVQAAVQRAEELIVLNEHAVDARYGLILHGAPGSGKTTVLTELAHRYMSRRPTPSTGGGVITVRLPPATTPRMLLGDLARALDTPVPARANTAELIRQVGGALLGATVGLVLVDEVHHLHTPAGSAVTASDALDYLCDHSPATFVFAGIDVIAGAASEITRNPYRRLMPIPLGFMAYDEAWRTLVSGVEKMLRLRQHAPGTLAHLSEHLHELTDGGGHRLAYLMRSGAIRAIHDGTEAITRERLDYLAAPWHTGRS